MCTSSASAGKKKPPPSTKQAPAPRTPARKRSSEDILAVRSSPRFEEMKKKKQRTEEQKGGRPNQRESTFGEEEGEEGDDIDEGDDALSGIDSQEELHDTLEVDEGIEEANLDPSSGAKQTVAKKNLVLYEKQFVTLAPRTGKRIKAVSFSKGFFHIPTLTAEGLKLMKSKKSK